MNINDEEKYNNFMDNSNFIKNVSFFKVLSKPEKYYVDNYISDKENNYFTDKNKNIWAFRENLNNFKFNLIIDTDLEILLNLNNVYVTLFLIFKYQTNNYFICDSYSYEELFNALDENKKIFIFIPDENNTKRILAKIID